MQRVKSRIAAGALAAASAALMVAGSAGGAPAGKTTICHHPASGKKPWVKIKVANPSLKAHAKHGDLIPAPAEGCPTDDDGGGGGGGGGGDVPT